MSSGSQADTSVRTDGGTTSSNAAALGTGVYLAVSLGTTVMIFVTNMLIDAIGDTGTGGSVETGEMLDQAVQTGASQTITFAILVAVGVGLLVGRDASRRDSPAVAGAAAAGVGVLVSLVVMLVLTMVLDLSMFTQGADDVPGELAGVVGVTVAAAISGAVAAGVGDVASR